MEDESSDPNIHAVFIDRGNSGFGFNIKGTTQFGGSMQAINGRLYPPLQYVSVVDPGFSVLVWSIAFLSRSSFFQRALLMREVYDQTIEFWK